MNSKKICLILPSLGGGGTERVFVNLANEWQKYNYQIEFVILFNNTELTPLLNKNINIKILGVPRIRNSTLHISQYLSKNKPDYILTALWPLTSIVVLAWKLSRCSAKLFLSEHVNFKAAFTFQKNNFFDYFILKKIIKLTHPLSSGIIAVSQGIKDDLCLSSRIHQNKVSVIYNPVSSNTSIDSSDQYLKSKLWGNKSKKNILAVGRLHPQKDFITLINAFSLLPKDLEAKLVILGQGPQRNELIRLISELNLQDEVILQGFVIDTSPWYKTADLFVLSSRWEGFGNVIVEALENGVPVVSTNCQSGPSEILDNGIYGKLVPIRDYKAMAESMVSALLSRDDEHKLKMRSQDFNISKIAKQYLDYFCQK